MKCDLCGQKVSKDYVVSYDAVEGSKLCPSCYDKVSDTAEPDKILAKDIDNDLTEISISSNKSNAENINQSNPVITKKMVISIAVAMAVIAVINTEGIIFKAIIFGPSIIAVLIAVFISSIAKSDSGKITFIVIALILHLISSFIIKACVGIGEAWSGYGTSHNLPTAYTMFGCFFIIVIATIRYGYCDSERN